MEAVRLGEVLAVVQIADRRNGYDFIPNERAYYFVLGLQLVQVPGVPGTLRGKHVYEHWPFHIHR